MARANAGAVEVVAVENFEQALEAISGEPVAAFALEELDQ